MGRGRIESELRRLRKAAKNDPRGAARVNRAAFQSTASDSRSDLVRLLSLLSITEKNQKNWHSADEILTRAESISKSGAIAKTELSGSRALLYLAQSLQTKSGWKETKKWADIHFAIAAKGMSRPAGKMDSSIHRARHRAVLLCSAYITMGQVSLFGYGDIRAATQDALSALSIAPIYKRPARVPHAYAPQISACSLLVTCIMRGGSSEDLPRGVAMIKALLPHTGPLDSARLLGSLAVLRTRLGSPGEGERLMIQALDILREIGATAAYDQMLDLLDWIILQDEGDRARARFMRREMESDRPNRPE